MVCYLEFYSICALTMAEEEPDAALVLTAVKVLGGCVIADNCDFCTFWRNIRYRAHLLEVSNLTLFYA